MSDRLLVFTAVTLEARAIRRATADLPHPPVVRVIGISAVQLPERLPGPTARLILIAGLAGALDPALSVGGVVVDDPGNVLPAVIPLRRGRITTTGQIVATPAEKATLFRLTGAAAVDMEQRLVFDRVAVWGVPCVGVRAISDTAAEALDPLVVGLVNPLGRVKIRALAATLLRRPWLAAYLLRLGRSSGLAAKHLGAAVREIAVAVDAASA